MGIELNGNVIFTLSTIFGVGLLSGLSPCTLPTVMLVIGYVGGTTETTKWRAFKISLAFIIGIAFTLSILGAFAGTFGGLFHNSKILSYMIAALVIFMGLWMLKVIDFNINGFQFLTPKKGSGALGAFILGLPFGILASPCTAPVVGAVLTFAASKGSSMYGFALLFTYAIGRSIPLLIVGTFTGLIKNMKKLEVFQTLFEKVGGVVLIMLGLYLLWLA